MSDDNQSDKLKEVYIDLESMTHYLTLLNHIYVELAHHNFKSVIEKFPASNIIAELIISISNVRFKLLKKIINNDKIVKSSSYEKFKFNENKVNHDVDALFIVIMTLCDIYTVAEHEKDFLNFILNLNETSIILCTLERMLILFDEIKNMIKSNLELYNQIDDETKDCSAVVYMLRHKFETEFNLK